MSKSTLPNNDHFVNEDYQAQFQPCPDEEPTPYVLISRKIINDNSINPFAKLYLLKILAEKPEWTFHYKKILAFLDKDDHIHEMDRVCQQMLWHEKNRKIIPSIKKLIKNLDNKFMEVI
jgi:hypothetical protein